MVDDDALVLRALSKQLTAAGMEVVTTVDPLEGLELATASDVDVVLCDVQMPNLTGLELLEALRKRGSDVEVVLMSGASSLDKATLAVKAGAWDYLAKPLDPERMISALRHAAERRRLARRTTALENQLEARHGFEALVGSSPKMLEVFKLIEAVAPTTATVLIHGESGTGKELVARAIHRRSPRSLQPFVTINCSAMTQTLLETELFGHVRGAFTGANTSRRGLFQAADGGTLFLDEVADMAASTQAALLRALQEGEVRPVGGTTPISVDVRVIAASHTELSELVSQGRFREDLFFRLKVVSITVPPLRERADDLTLLITHLLRRFGARDGRPAAHVTEGALARLLTHRWPGNVRELENVLERATLLCGGAPIGEAHLPPELQGERRDTAALTHLPIKEARQAVVEAFERRYLRELLSRFDGNISQCAEAAGMARSNLRKLLKEYQLRESGTP
ncbi:MAG: sigma-54 dependent transcriptional regulator [Archangium sp.]